MLGRLGFLLPPTCALASASPSAIDFAHVGSRALLRGHVLPRNRLYGGPTHWRPQLRRPRHAAAPVRLFKYASVRCSASTTQPAPPAPSAEPKRASVRLAVSGMRCAGCVKKLEEALAGTAGVHEATVNLATNEASVAFDPRLVSARDLIATVAGKGFGASVAEGAARSVRLQVRGMKCGGCARKVEGALLAVPGVLEAAVNLPLAEATVSLADGCGAPAELARALTAAGFPSAVAEEADGDEAAVPASPLAPVAAAAVLFALAAVPHAAHVFGGPLAAALAPLHAAPFQAAVAAAAALGPGREIVLGGLDGFRRGNITMDSLVAAGVLAAFVGSGLAAAAGGPAEAYFHEPTMLLAVLVAARVLEGRARREAARGFQSLVLLTPRTARLLRPRPDAPSHFAGAAEEEVPAASVPVGGFVRVRAGDRVPLDGTVVEGEATADESALTGEPVPVYKGPGSTVAAPALISGGPLVVRTSAAAEETSLARLVAVVRECQARKAPVQRLADAIVGPFTLAVLSTAAAVFAFWAALGPSLAPAAFAGPSPALDALRIAVGVLVVACPCALGLATPTAVLVGSAAGAARGVLVRGGDVLESLAGVSAVVLDKTGTLTAGRGELSDLLPLPASGLAPGELLSLAAAAESASSHPLAAAVAAASAARGLPPLPADAHRSAAGRGAAARVHRAGAPPAAVLVGSAAFLAEEGCGPVPEALAAPAAALAAAGRSVAFVAVDGAFAGLLAVWDPLRPDAAAAVRRLRAAGLRVLLLSGDRPEAVAAAARAAGIEAADAFGGVSPAEKAAAVARVQAEEAARGGGRVAMVGDGVNDAAALAQADVAMTLQGGTDVAAEAAQVLLLRGELAGVADAVLLGRLTLRTIRLNLALALGYNAAALPLAAGALLPAFGVLVPPPLAGAAMACSSLAVLSSSLLLRPAFLRAASRQ